MSKVMHNLDELPDLSFLIIGAQKSGTTALFRYLKEHPQIYIPPQKELEFFNDLARYRKGKSWYLKHYFSDSVTQAVRGEASTHYMMYDECPRRIYETFPKIKLIAILRNPIDRAFSHWRMSVRRGKESRKFEEAIEEQIKLKNGIQRAVDIHHDYLAFGEYGRILKHYLRFFNHDQLHVMFKENLERSPHSEMTNLLRFIGVDQTNLPNNLGKKYHISGPQRIPGANFWVKHLINWLKRQKWGWRVASPQQLGAFMFWFETQFNVKQDKELKFSYKVRQELIQFYKDDVALLEEIIEEIIPWDEFKS